MTPLSLSIAVSPDTDTSDKNYENILTFLCKNLEFPTKWYTKLNDVVKLLHSLETVLQSQIFNIFEKRTTRKTPKSPLLIITTIKNKQ